MHGLGGDLSPSQATTIEYTSEIGVPLGLGPTGPPGSEVQDQNTNTTSLGGGPLPKMQRARKQQTCKQHRPSGPNPERGVTSSPCGQPTWGLVKYHGSRWGPRGPEWGDTWTCPCAPQGLAKAHVPHPAGRPNGKIQTLHLGGGIPREVRRRPLPVFRQNPKTAQKKNGRSSPLRRGNFLGVSLPSAHQRRK